MLSAIISKGTYSQLEFSSGNVSIVTALLMINGNASLSFHMPRSVSSMAWPIGSIVASAPAPSTAACTMCSLISFDCAYPVSETCSISLIGVSGMRAGGGVPDFVEIEEQNMNRASSEEVTSRDNWSRFCKPFKEDSKKRLTPYH